MVCAAKKHNPRARNDAATTESADALLDDILGGLTSEATPARCMDMTLHVNKLDSIAHQISYKCRCMQLSFPFQRTVAFY